jgi:hypothetical protein
MAHRIQIDIKHPDAQKHLMTIFDAFKGRLEWLVGQEPVDAKMNELFGWVAKVEKYRLLGIVADGLLRLVIDMLDKQLIILEASMEQLKEVDLKSPEDLGLLKHRVRGGGLVKMDHFKNVPPR